MCRADVQYGAFAFLLKVPPFFFFCRSSLHKKIHYINFSSYLTRSQMCNEKRKGKKKKKKTDVAGIPSTIY